MCQDLFGETRVSKDDRDVVKVISDSRMKYKVVKY